MIIAPDDPPPADASQPGPDIPPVVNPFTVAIDTREQAPWSFRNIRGDARERGATVVVPTQRMILRTGDYSIVGFESQFCIERKSKEDLYQTLIYERERFERELVRMAAMPLAFVVVECSWAKLLEPLPNSGIKPKSISRTIMALMCDHHRACQWVFGADRRWCEIWALQHMRTVWRRFCSSWNSSGENVK